MSTLKAYSRLVGVAVMLLLLPMSAQAAGAPHIASLTPTYGPTGGSTNVTIAGDNFTDVAAVTFGGTPATSFSVVSSTTITCITPGHAAGAVDVVVTTAGGNATKTGGFTYVADAVANAYPPVIQGNAQAMAVDAAGNRYVTGYFSGAVDFNSGVGLDPKASAGGFDAFVTRFNADGTYAWTQTFGGTSDDYGRGVAVSPDGKWVYVTGSFKSTDAGIGGAGTVTSSGASDAFILALNALDGGAVLGFGSDGVQKFGGKGDDEGFGVAVSPDGATIYVTGQFNSIDAGLGGMGTFASSGGYDAFVLALKAADGSAISSFGTGGIQKFGGTADDYGRGVVVAPNGASVYVTGYFNSKDAGIGGTGGVIRLGGFDAFVLALNASTGLGVGGFGSGGIQKIGGTNDDYGYGVAVSPDGKRVYVTGSFKSSDAGIGTTGSFGSSGGLDAFVVALSSGIGSGVGGFGSGGFQSFGGSSTDSGQGVAVSPDGAMIYVTGYFKSTDAGIGGTGTVASAGSYDAFVLALNAPDGGAVLGFGSGGVQTFGGTNDDEGYGVAVSPDGAKIYAAGYFSSTDARVGGAGSYYEATGFGGFLLELDAPPTINTVRPVCGDAAGGTNVWITGTNFFSGATVTFGGTAATLVTVLSSTAIKCFTPAHPPGRVDVVVTTSGGSATKTGGFTYVADAVASVYPPVIQGVANGVAVDAAGNRYVAGYFSGAVDFNPGVGVDAKASAGSEDAFVTRFNADGTYAWTQTFGGTSADRGEGVAVSPDGTRVYVTGYFRSTDAGIEGTGSVRSSGFDDAFVLALNAADGSAISGFGSGGVQQFGGTGVDRGWHVAVSPDGSRVYVAGDFSSTDAGIGNTGSIFSSGGYDAFVLALNTLDGSAIVGFGSGGVQRFGGSLDDFGSGVAVSPDGTRVFVTGYFNSPGAGIGGTLRVSSAGGYDAFVLALDANSGLGVVGFGGSDGVQVFGGSLDDYGFGVAVSPNGSRVYVAGGFYSPDAGIAHSGINGSSGFVDAFVLALNASDGSATPGFGIVGVQTFGGTDFDQATGVAVSPDGSRVYVAGDFTSTNAGIGHTGSVASSGNSDAFVLALSTADGSAISGFGSGGVQKFGGTDADEAYCVAVSPDGAKVYAAGWFDSTNAHVGGTGPVYDSTGFGGFLLGLDVPPSISTIRPACGGTGGGTSVTIRGSAFTSSVTVTFGGTAASVTALSSTMITCTTPAHGNGPVDVVVTTAGGSATMTGGFTYVADAVANVYPPVIQGAVYALAVDAAGNRYVAGYFAGALDFNPGVGLDAKATSVGAQNAFVTRFNTDGTYAWTQTFGGTGADFASSVAVSPDGTRVYVTGYFSSTDAGIGGTGSFASLAGFDTFVLALNAADGSAISSFGSGGIQTFGGTGDDKGRGVAVSPDGTRVYVTGYFASNNAGIGGSGSIASLGGDDAFVLALSASTGLGVGGFGSGGVQKFSGANDERGTGVAVSPDGSRVYVTGYFNSSNAGIGGTGSIASLGGDDAFVLALSASTGLGVGGFGSGGVQTFGGTSSENGLGVAVSPDGLRVYATGYFNSNDAGIGGTVSIGSSGGVDAFVLALNAADGSAITGFGSGGVQKFGGTSDDRGWGVAVSPDGTRVYVTGYFNSNDAGIGGTVSIASSGGADAFVLALNAADGGAVLGFGSGGVQKFGGTDNDFGYGVAVSPDGAKVYAAGWFYSTNARVGGAGSYYDATGFGGFLLGLDAPPSISTIRPICGGTGGGTSVTIRGSAFTSGATVTFGGAPASVTAVNSTTITCTTPGHPAGVVDVVVTTAGGSATKTPGFAYVADAVANVYPPVIQGYAVALAVDAAGNRYVAGYFWGAVDFNPGVGLDAKAANWGTTNAFVTRFNADGTYAWTQTFGGWGDDHACGVAVSPDGLKVYVTGYFTNTDAGLGGTGSVNSSGGYDAFVLALNASDGSAVGGFGSGGIQKFGGTGYDMGRGVAVSPDGARVYVTGFFNSLDADIGHTGSVASSGDYDAFVLALSAADGSALGGFGSGGVQKFGGTGVDYGWGLAVSGTTVYATGSFSSSAVRIGGAGPSVANSGSGWDAYVIALDAATGAAKTSFGLSSSGIQKFGGTSDDEGEGVAVSPDGARVYVTGYFTGTDAGIGSTGSVASSGNWDAFVLALNANTGLGVGGFGSGGIQTFGGADRDGAYGVVASPDGSRVYVTGDFASTNAGIGGTVSIASSGGNDAFVLALSTTDGSAISGFGSGGVQKLGGGGGDWGYGVAVSPDGTKVYAAGSFYSTDARVGGTGPAYVATGFYGFLLGLDVPPSINTIRPACGGTGGSTSVTITGSAFTSGATVTFGGTPATSVHVVNSTTITCTTPGHAAGPVDVVVTTPGGSETKTGGFTYVADAVANVYPPVIQWYAEAVAVDAAGNRYVAGHFWGAADFNPVVGVDAKASAGDVDAFVTRFNADGTYAWTQTFGGSGSDYAWGVAVSPDGLRVYVTGSFSSLDAGIGGLGSVASSGGENAFVLALNAADGSAINGFGSGGIQKFGGTGGDQGHGVAVSPDGSRVYVTGLFNSIDAGIGGTGSVASSGDYDAFVVALNASDGSAVGGFGSAGVQKFGGRDHDYGYGVAVSPDGTRVYVTGSFNSLDAGIGGLGSVASLGGLDTFVLALNAADGSAISGFGSAGVQKFGGTGSDEGFGAAVSPDGSRVYVAGYFASSNAGIGSLGSVASSGWADAFVLALSTADGSAISGFGSAGVQKFGGTGYDYGYGVAVSPDGSRVYVAGYFDSNNAGIGALGSVASSGNFDAFVLALNAPDGSAITGFGSGGTQKFGGTDRDCGRGVAVSPDGARVYAAGEFYSTNAGVGGTGTYDALDFGGFLLGLNATTGQQAPTRLVITQVNGGMNPAVGVPFAVSVESRNPQNAASAVMLDTAIHLTLRTGTGALGGTLNGTIAAGTSSATIPGVTYTTAEGGVVVTVSRTSGDTLAPGDSAPFTVAGPFAKFAFVLASPQTDGVAFTGANTLTAQDASGNTVTRFDASADNVKVFANAPLTGMVSGLGSAGNYQLNQAGDFVAGVADLTALGMKYTGNVGTGTFTAKSASAKTGTSGSVTIDVGALNDFLVEAAGGGPIGAQTVAVPFNIRITARDVGNNTAAAFTGTAALTSNGALAGAPLTTASFTDGVLASQSVTINSVRSDTTITATLTGGGPSGTSNAFAVRKNQMIAFSPLADKTYGDTPFTVSATASSGLPVSFSIFSGPATSADDQVTITAAGTVVVRASQEGNGLFNAAPDVDQPFTVLPEALLVSGIGASSKEYDGAPTATLTGTPGTLVGIVGADDVSLSGSAVGAFADKNVATGKTVTVSGQSLTGAQAGNYTLTEPTATADITARALTVTATGHDKVHDGTTVATVTLSDDKLVGDDVTADYASAAFDTPDLGTAKTVTVSGISISGADAGNYTFNTTATTTADITPFQITARETVDSDHDGYIDAIRMVANAPLNDNFDGLQVTVNGYLLAASAYDTGGCANDKEFFVRLQEGASPDTGATPDVQVVAVGSLGLYGSSELLPVDTVAVPATDGAAPVLLQAWLTRSTARSGIITGVDEGDTLFLKFSEALTTTQALAVSDFDLPVQGDSFGAGATVAASQTDDTQLIVTLGSNPQLTPGGTYPEAPNPTAAGKPTGISVVANAGLGDAVGNGAYVGAAVDLDPGQATLSIAWLFANGDLSIDTRHWYLDAASLDTQYLANDWFATHDGALNVLNNGDVMATLYAACSGSTDAGWTLATSAGPDNFEMKVLEDGQITIELAGVGVGGAAISGPLYSGQNQPFNLQFRTPTSITSGLGESQTITVTITAVKD